MSISSWWFDRQRALFFFWCPVVFTTFLFGAVWFHNLAPLGPDIPAIILLYYVLYT